MSDLALLLERAVAADAGDDDGLGLHGVRDGVLREWLAADHQHPLALRLGGLAIHCRFSGAMREGECLDWKRELKQSE